MIIRGGHSKINAAWALIEGDEEYNPSDDIEFADCQLSEMGAKQCELKAQQSHLRMPNLKVIFVSPLRRAL